MNVIYNLEFSCDKSRMDYPHNQHFYVILRKMELQLTDVDNLIYYEATNGAKLSYELSSFCLFSNSKSDYYGRIGCYKEEFKILLRNLSLPQFIQKLKNHTETVKLYTVYKILRKSMIYVYFISCFNEPLLFRLLLQRSSTVGFSASVNSVVRLPTNILFPSINGLLPIPII